jgi:hypothetical protein
LLNLSETKPELLFHTSGLHAGSAAQVEKMLGGKMTMRGFHWDGMQIVLD